MNDNFYQIGYENKVELSIVVIVICYFVLFLGVEHLSTYLKVYKVGDIIDIKVGRKLVYFGWLSRE